MKNYAKKEMKRDHNDTLEKKSNTKEGDIGGIEKQNRQDIYKTNSTMTEVSLSLSVVTVNVNGLNSPVKRQR